MRDRDIYCELLTDDRGWPLIKFDPDDEELRLAGAFLQEDVGLLQTTCDEVMQGVQRVMEDREGEWIWNGDRFLVRVRKDGTNLTDKYGKDGLDASPVFMDTRLFVALVRAWTRFVASIPRQREFARIKTA